jgi:hypothetical protein
MLKQFTFKQLEQVLSHLGFEETKVRENYVVFMEPETDTLIGLPIPRANLGLPYLRMVEKILEEKEILNRGELEKLFLTV